MSTQLRNASRNNVIPVSERIADSRPSLGGLTCRTCHAKSNCMLERVKLKRGQLTLAVNNNKKVIAHRSHVFRSGDLADALYIIRSGSIKSYALTEDGEEQVLNFHLPGDLVGLESIGIDRHITSSIALETTTLCRLPLDMLSTHELGAQFLEKVAGYLIRDHNMKLVLARKDADGRLASFLIELSGQLNKLGQSEEMITLTMTRQDIANYLGVAIETVSRTLRRFQDSGVLEITRRNIRIFDFYRLRSIAGTQITRHI